MEVYPSKDIVRQADAEAVLHPQSAPYGFGGDATCCPGPVCPADPSAPAASRRRKQAPPRALIVAVEPESPADDAGFEPGCYLTHVDEHPLRDIIDWRWLSAEDVIEVGYVDLDGEAGTVELEREEGEDWGFSFEGVVFDSIKLCRNACTFCFMRQLPPHMRPSLSLRDDDFRLSFLSGTFVTLTNLTPEDEARIVEQRISPLRVSLHATDPDARRALIGRHAQHGLDALERLLSAGIEVHAQIVLVPEANDKEVLEKTLRWAYERPGILNIGIVPLGFTKYQDFFDHSFNDPQAALDVIRIVEPYQRRALAERATPWVFAADEFYRNAYLELTAEKIPPTSHYGDFSMFEDGIGIIRSYVDEFEAACVGGLARRAADALDAAGLRVRYVIGEAMQPFLDRMIERSPLAGRLVPLTVRNTYFGGNVDVTGLLCACDIAEAIRSARAESSVPRPVETPIPPAAKDSAACSRSNSPACVKAPEALSARAELALCTPEPSRQDVFVIPSVILNDDGVTLDDATVEDVEKAAGVPVAVVSCNPLDYLNEIISIANGRHI